MPTIAQPNGSGTMETTATYASSWAPASMTGPNGDKGTTTYDSYGRPSQTTTPDGGVTTYTNTYSPELPRRRRPLTAAGRPLPSTGLGEPSRCTGVVTCGVAWYLFVARQRATQAGEFEAKAIRQALVGGRNDLAYDATDGSFRSSVSRGTSCAMHWPHEARQ